jgi:hypothetical protein
MRIKTNRNEKTKQPILVKTTKATNKIIKPTEIIRKKPDENTGIKSSEVEPAPFVNEIASSEDIYFDASDVKAPSKDISATIDAPAAASVATPAPTPAVTSTPVVTPATAVTLTSVVTPNETKLQKNRRYQRPYLRL